MKSLQLSQDFNADDFLKHYWQKKPVLFSGLINNFTDAISAEELAGLACEDFIESRLVTEFDKGNWQLRSGPFTETDFSKLPDSNWTLLVQAVDQWFEEVADIKTLFDFIPNWRIEDIMISYATPGGGVGPHFDYYDVFLIQGLGRRKWQVGAPCSAASKLKAGSELGTLQSFEATEQFQLNPGDALYIPPRFAHWGTAETESLCYSVGFRAPSVAEMIEGFSDFLIKEQDPGLRYQDGDLSAINRSGEIEAALLDSSFQMLAERFQQKQKFINWFGCYVSQPKYPELVQSLETPLSAKEFAMLLETGVVLQRNPSSRFAFIESQGNSSVLLFIDGATVKFALEHIENISLLCAALELDASILAELSLNPDMAELLRRLLNQGSLLLPE